jgi:hypothetical protein
MTAESSLQSVITANICISKIKSCIVVLHTIEVAYGLF